VIIGVTITGDIDMRYVMLRHYYERRHVTWHCYKMTYIAIIMSLSADANTGVTGHTRHTIR